MTISKGRAMFEAAWRVFLATFVMQVFSTVQATTNFVDLASIEFWKVLVVSAGSAALAAGLRLLVPQPVDKPGVGVAGIAAVRSTAPRERPF